MLLGFFCVLGDDKKVPRSPWVANSPKWGEVQLHQCTRSGSDCTLLLMPCFSILPPTLFPQGFASYVAWLPGTPFARALQPPADRSPGIAFLSAHMQQSSAPHPVHPLSDPAKGLLILGADTSQTVEPL